MCQQNSWRRRQGQPAFLRMFSPAKRRATTTAVARIATPGDVEMPRRLDGRPIGSPVPRQMRPRDGEPATRRGPRLRSSVLGCARKESTACAPQTAVASHTPPGGPRDRKTGGDAPASLNISRRNSTGLASASAPILPTSVRYSGDRLLPSPSTIPGAMLAPCPTACRHPARRCAPATGACMS